MSTTRWFRGNTSAPSVCGGGVGSSAAHAGSEVVRHRAALEHEYELQQAQMEIDRLSVALKLSEAANDGLRDANNKLRMLLYKRSGRTGHGDERKHTRAAISEETEGER